MIRDKDAPHYGVGLGEAMHLGALAWSLITLIGAADSRASAPPEALGSPLRVGPYSIRPPAPFHALEMGPYERTRAGAIAASEKGEDGRGLEVALTDGWGREPSAESGEPSEVGSMLISTVEGGFTAAPSGRDDLAAAALRHFSEELGLELGLERADLVVSGQGATPRVEVLGSIRQPGQVRRVLIAALEGSPRHVVVIFSLPSGRFEALRPVLRASLDSFRREGGAPGPAVSQTVLGVTAALLGALFLLALRKRKAPSI